MEQLIIVAHVVAAIAIIALILIQQGRGADMGASFGGGGSQTVFGPAGSGTVLTRATAGLAALFFATSFCLAIVAKEKAAAVTGVDIDIPVVLEEGLLQSAPVESQAAPVSEEIPVGDTVAPATLPASEIPE
jgi:preprotein translocase subunit SecG